MFIRRRLWLIVMSISLASFSSTMLTSCSGCGDILYDECVPDLPPDVGGQPNVSGSIGNTIVATWAAATDKVTAAAQLSYRVMYSTSNNISTPADALANGIAAIDWTPNITTASISGLNYSTTYYVAVLVKNEREQTSIYPVTSYKTGTAPLVLSNGGQIACPAGTVMTGFGGRTGAIIDQLFLQCAPESNPTQATAVQGPGVGGQGGQPTASRYCPDGSYVTAVNGAVGTLFLGAVASIEATCSTIPAQTIAIAPGFGNTPFQHSCPPGQKAYGLDMLATPNGGAYVGSVNQILCR
jgi:hypothetical protein